MTEANEIIDCWVNVPVGKPDDSASYLFPGLSERWSKLRAPVDLIDEMDVAGISKAVLVSGWGPEDSISWVTRAMKEYPGRFAASHIIDPREGVRALKLISHLVNNENYRLVRMLAFATQIPYGDPRCYPVYAKCAELGIPISVNVGIPGPQVPSKCQDPFPLDEVCYHFPELSVVMAHGGEPWQALCVKLMLKWPNLHYMTSAFAPLRIPSDIMHYLNSRGAGRVMFASDHPIITFHRCLQDLPRLEFRDPTVKSKFLFDNAKKLFFPD